MNGQTVTAIGSGVYPILPPYQVRFLLRSEDELVQVGDYYCFGLNPHNLHSWTKIHPDSPMIGKQASHYTRAPIGVKIPLS